MTTSDVCVCGHTMNQHEIRAGGMFSCYIHGCRCVDFRNPCEATKSSCRCALRATHSGHHHCECGGAWQDDGTIVLFPNGLTLEEAVDAVVDAAADPFELLDLFGPDDQ